LLVLGDVPNSNDTILTTCSEHSIATGGTTPLYLIYLALVIFINKLGLRLLGGPKTNQILRTATCKHFPTWVPLNLLNVVGVSTAPDLEWTSWRINRPIVYLL